MFINEYSDKNNPLVLLLAPMMVWGASLGVAIGYRIFPDPDFTVHHA